MAGHSKWSNIKRRKEAVDSKKSKVFSKIIRDLTVAAREGGDSLDTNPTLRTIVDKAKAANLPAKNIQRAIDKGAGNLEGQNAMEITYEGYGPAGVGFIVKCLTDNKNRTVTEVRQAFNKNGGSMGESGSAAYMFEDNYEPTFKIDLNENDTKTFDNILSALEDLEDVLNVYHNANNEIEEK